MKKLIAILFIILLVLVSVHADDPEDAATEVAEISSEITENTDAVETGDSSEPEAIPETVHFSFKS